MSRVRVWQAVAAVALLVAACGTAWAATQGDTEVRINARQLEDGRVEFALQQRDGDDWSERMLADKRYFPAEVGHDRWLNSSPYAVSVEVETEGEDAQQTIESAGEERAAYGVLAFGFHGDSSVFYYHGDAGVNGQRTSVKVSGTASDSLYDEAALGFVCDHDTQSLWVYAEVGVTIGDEWRAASLNDYDGVTLAAFGTISEQEWERRGFETFDDDAQVSGADATMFFVDALTERWVSVSLPMYNGSVKATFDLQSAFDTPVQGLLMGCNRAYDN